MMSIQVTELASAARTTTGQSVGSAMPNEYEELNVYLNVTAVSGTTPSMTVTYQCSPDGTNWYDHTSGSAITAAANQLIKVNANIGKFGRLSYVISGTTPSFTFSAILEGKRP
jgi:hypothetical protein